MPPLFFVVKGFYREFITKLINSLLYTIMIYLLIRKSML